MKIALDYDLTYSVDPDLWDAFIADAQRRGHDCRVVTGRDDRFDRTAPLVEVEKKHTIVWTRGSAKLWFCERFTDRWIPDVWIDDRPQSVFENSPTTPFDLAMWRSRRADGPTIPVTCACGGSCKCA